MKSHLPIAHIHADDLIAIDAHWEPVDGYDAVSLSFIDPTDGTTDERMSLYREQILPLTYALVRAWVAIWLHRLRRR